MRHALGLKLIILGQNACGIGPTFRQLQSLAETGKVGERERGIDDLRIGLHHIDLALGIDQFEDRFAGGKPPDRLPHDIRWLIKGLADRRAQQGHGDLGARRHVDPAEGPGFAGRGLSLADNAVNQPVAKAIELDRVGIQLPGERLGVQLGPGGLGAGVVAERVVDCDMQLETGASGPRSSAGRTGRRQYVSRRARARSLR
jgi:hypothetical protein